ncbi:MAG: DUF177 domain-containing protein [Oscillospiraceae bacterium]|nr:DUF177 domain-containing protein [Oscillospiraceae bacterium]
MVINLRQLYEIVGEVKTFDCEVSPERLAQVKGYSFKGPVTVKGVLRNRAGVLLLSYSVSFTLNAQCDRCLAEFEKELCFESEYVLVRELSSSDDGDEYIVTEGDSLDLDELAVDDLLLQMPTRLLCKEDCKGLCPVCGADLNVTDCGCAPLIG